MSTSAGTAGQSMDSQVLYAIHYAPIEDGLPQIPRFNIGLPRIPWMKILGPSRALYAILTVGGESKRCHPGKEQSLEFIAGHSANVRIELYAERFRGDILVAFKECSLGSLTSLDTPVHLDVCDSRVARRPKLQLSATVTPFQESLASEVAALRPELSISDKWSAIVGYSKTVIRMCGALGEAVPPSQTVFALLDLGLDKLEKRMEYHKEIVALVDETSRICEVVIASDKGEFKDKRKEQGKACNALITELLRVASFLRDLASENFVKRSRTKVNEHVHDMLRRLQALARYVESAHLDAQNAVFRIEEKFDNENTLRHLPMANTQAGTSKGCLLNTRVQLLAAVMDWALNPNGTRCLVLHGAAGKGKSAVANSVARILSDMGAIAPFFAFDRTNPARHAHQLYPTFAGKLARYDQQYLDNLRSLPTEQLETIDIKDQHRNLMLAALRRYQTRVPTVFVVDALDECRNDDDNSIGERATLIRTLRACIRDRELPPSIRFLITTRPDYLDIASLLQEDGAIVAGRSIDHEENTESDIRKVVEENLQGIDASGLVDDVVRASQSLFECAAVLCRELTGPNQPKSNAARQNLIRSIRHEPGHPRLYEIYRFVLHTHIGTNDPVYLSTYRQFLAWVLSVRQPQPGVVFQEFAEVLLDGESIDGMLVHLGSLLTGTHAGDNASIRPLHTSFRDFVLNAEASGPFTIKPEFAAADSQLALACFGIMDRPQSGLRYNICDLPSPFVYKRYVENLDELLSKHVSLGLRYACREVSVHLSHGQPSDSDLLPAFKRFLENQFLFWLEACGWQGYEPCDSLRNMLHLVEKLSQGDLSLAAIVTDFIAFEKRFREAMSESPPQVYVTGLLFAPVDSQVSRLYGHRIVSPIDISGYEEQEWPPSETLVIQAGSDVHSVAHSPDGTKIVAGLYDNELRLWDAETGRQVGEAMRGHNGVAYSVAFSPDGSRIASGSGDCTVRLWDAKTGQQQGEALRGHTQSVRSVAFSSDGITVVSASDDCTLRLWDAKAGKKIGEAMEGHTDGVNSVVFSHDGARIISGAYDCTVRIWETATQQQLGDSIRHEYRVTSVTISPDGKYIASGSGNGTVCVWDAGGRQQVWESHGNTKWVVCSVTFSPDSTRIVSGGLDATVLIWDVVSGEQVGDDLRGHTSDIRSVAFSPDGKHVASGSLDGTMRIWDVREAKKENGIPVGHTHAVTSVACSPDGKYIVSGSRDMTVRLWNARTGQPVGDPMTGHDGNVNSVTFSPDSTRIASASDDRKVRVWDVETRLPVGVLQRHNSRALCVAFSPDATRLVSGSVDGTLHLWDLVAGLGEQIGEPLYGHPNWAESVSLSSDGRYIACSSKDSSIQLWDASSKLQREALKGHQKSVQSLAFSPDDLYLVSGSRDRTIRLWDVKSGEQMGGPLTGHTDWVRSVSFSPDWKYVVSGSDDRTVRVWSAQTRQQVGVSLRGHEGRVNSVAFTSDGARIVSGSGDGTIQVWDFGKLQILENTLDAASADTTRPHVQASLRENDCHWHVYDDDGVERPVLWIPHHLRHYHRITSPYQIHFVPPAPHIRITLNDPFRLNEWPTYAPTPAPKEPLEALV